MNSHPHKHTHTQCTHTRTPHARTHACVHVQTQARKTISIIEIADLRVCLWTGRNQGLCVRARVCVYACVCACVYVCVRVCVCVQRRVHPTLCFFHHHTWAAHPLCLSADAARDAPCVKQCFHACNTLSHSQRSAHARGYPEPPFDGDPWGMFVMHHRKWCRPHSVRRPEVVPSL